jgi:magnesium chelatase subunit I
MKEQNQSAPQPDTETDPNLSQPPVRSLRELIDRVSGRHLESITEADDAGIVTEVLPFPFLALVGQQEMKLALLLALINPNIGGVLLVGPRGTGKTTAVRSLVDLLPKSPRSLCYYGCMPEDIETGGIDAVCPDCAKKYGIGDPLAVMDRVRLIELPLNSQIDDVVGGLSDRAALHDRMRLKRGILSQADRNLLFVDEVNLLSDEVVDAILDAAAQGSYTVRRGPLSATYRSRFALIGSMNPEEGRLRPQILDRFGLRLMVRGLEESSDRLEAYRRVQAYLASPRETVSRYAHETAVVQAEIENARSALKEVELPDEIAEQGLEIIKKMDLDSLRAEITLFEAARAHAAADQRTQVTGADLKSVASMALRLRRSAFIVDYFSQQSSEEEELAKVLQEIVGEVELTGGDPSPAEDA